MEETLEILRKANEESLVLQRSNSKEMVNISCCSVDCCQIVINLKRDPFPAVIAAISFVARGDPEVCIGCKTCVGRCQMEALSNVDSP